MAEFGIPYMGSKDKICDRIIKLFPKSDNFYDLFGGGFSITHAMLLKRKSDFKQFHFNEIRPGVCDLIKESIAGKYNYNVFKPPFVSRDEFFDKLDSDPAIKILWSFGNNGSAYLFSKEIEPYKKSMHNAIVFNEFDELAEKTLGVKKFNDGYTVKQKRLFLRNKIEFYRKTKVPEFLWPYLNEKNLEVVKANKKADNFKQLERLQQLEQLERLQQLEQLEQLERLQQLEQLQRLQQLEQLQRLQRLQQLEQLERLQQLEQLEFYNLSYEQVPIKENSVIYCDPPYAGTAEYDGGFDHKKFLDWCHEQKNPVFISEYEINDDRFSQVLQIKKRSMLSSNKKMKVKLERVYVNKAGLYKTK